MTRSACPDVATLEALLADALSPAMQESLAEHMERCPRCRQRLDERAWPAEFHVPGVEGRWGPPGRATAFDPPRGRLEQWRQAVRTDATVAGTEVARRVLARLDGARDADELGGLGPYRVRRVLGQGGMGIVLLATDPALRRPVALKLMLPGLTAHPESRERFLREARAAAAVQHENVVTIHSVEEGGDLPYLVMEYVPGRSLEHRLHAEGPLPAAEVARLGAQVAEGLASAHARGVVHRDVKPANILLDERTGRAKLGDFGLARAGDDPALTRVGFVAGTPQYIAPEQARGAAIDHRADLYSLGATLYAAVTGAPPASSGLGSPPHPAQVAAVPVRKVAPRTPRALASLIDRLLAADPKSRPQTAREVADALRRVGESRTRTRLVRCGVAVVVACGVGAAICLAPGPQAEPLPERQQAVPPVAVPATSSGPFVVDGTRRFGSLAEAIAAARSGAVVEIRADGPHPTRPIHLGEKALTIRGAPGCLPVIELVRGDEGAGDPSPCLTTDATLTLEGLSLRSEGPGTAVAGDDPAGFSMLVARGGPFRARHCRFSVGPRSACLALVRGAGEIEDCQFLAGDALALAWAPGPQQTLRLARTLLATHNAIVLDIDRAGAGTGRSTLRIDHATVRATSAVRVHGAGARFASGLSGSPWGFVRIEAEGSVFDAENILVFMNTTASGRIAEPAAPAKMARQIRSQFAWRGRDNLYPISPHWLAFANRGRAVRAAHIGPTSLEEWGRIWSKAEDGSTAAALAFRGRADSPEASDHALRIDGDRARTRAGDPPGAPVEHIGPGAPHDAWRASLGHDPSLTTRSGSR